MYCNRCGAPLQPDSKACPKCGAAVIHPFDSPPCPPFGESRFARHVRTLGILWMVAGALWLVPSFALLSVGGLFRVGFRPDFFPHAFAPPFPFMLGSVFLLVAAAGVSIGWGLYEHQPWARAAALVLACLILLRPPFGTALGLYSLWLLLSGNAASEYERLARNP
jgi:hypothetical protein